MPVTLSEVIATSTVKPVPAPSVVVATLVTLEPLFASNPSAAVAKLTPEKEWSWMVLKLETLPPPR